MNIGGTDNCYQPLPIDVAYNGLIVNALSFDIDETFNMVVGGNIEELPSNLVPFISYYGPVLVNEWMYKFTGLDG